ncbi:hypothetical protein KCM76_15585 [Zooshikella marina]|nr:hypothetical protein [Zooshikella ganghwensis]MBU2707414.1 hypothetical protein [Zooshikella ganghwensis]
MTFAAEDHPWSLQHMVFSTLPSQPHSSTANPLFAITQLQGKGRDNLR